MECHVCADAITSWFYTNPLFGDIACAQCVEIKKRICDWCGRYKETTIHLGKRSCGSCRESSISTEADIYRLKGITLEILHRHLGPNSYDKLPISFDELIPLDYAPNPLGQAFFGGPDPEIRLWRGMPLGFAVGVLAHEYGHMALNLNHQTLMNRPGLGSREKKIEEGFCEVVNAVALLTQTSDDSRFMSFLMPGNPDPIYGDGFRLMWPRAIELGSVGALLQELTGETHPYRGPSPDELHDEFTIPDDIEPLVEIGSGDREKGVLRGTALHVKDLPKDVPIGPRLRGRGLVAADRDMTETGRTSVKGTLRGAGLTEKKKPETPKPLPTKGGLRGKGLDKK